MPASKIIKAFFTRSDYDATVPRYRLVKLVNAVTLDAYRVGEVLTEGQVKQYEHSKLHEITIR